MAALISALVLTGCSSEPENGVPGQKQMDRDLTSVQQTLADYVAESTTRPKPGSRFRTPTLMIQFSKRTITSIGCEGMQNGSYSVWGVYFADYECSLGEELSRNTVIYGHSSLNDETEGKKFTELKKLNLQDFAKDHSVISFLQLGLKEYVATIFSVGYWAASCSIYTPIDRMPHLKIC